ncbi:hypothetical protein LXL04_026081 [Taraxacum kok-saghyz]
MNSLNYARITSVKTKKSIDLVLNKICKSSLRKAAASHLHLHQPRSTLTSFRSRHLLSFTPISYLLHRIYTLSVRLYINDFRYRFVSFLLGLRCYVPPTTASRRRLLHMFYLCDYMVGVSAVKPPPIVADFRSSSLDPSSPISDLQAYTCRQFQFQFQLSNEKSCMIEGGANTMDHKYILRICNHSGHHSPNCCKQHKEVADSLRMGHEACANSITTVT